MSNMLWCLPEIQVNVFFNFYTDQTDKGEKKNLSKRNDAEYQVVTVEEPERQQLLTDGTDQIKDLKERQAAGIRPEVHMMFVSVMCHDVPRSHHVFILSLFISLQEEQHMKKVAVKLLKLLKEELETKKTEVHLHFHSLRLWFQFKVTVFMCLIV